MQFYTKICIKLFQRDSFAVSLLLFCILMQDKSNESKRHFSYNYNLYMIKDEGKMQCVLMTKKFQVNVTYVIFINLYREISYKIRRVCT